MCEYLLSWLIWWKLRLQISGVPGLAKPHIICKIYVLIYTVLYFVIGVVMYDCEKILLNESCSRSSSAVLLAFCAVVVFINML